MLCVFDCLAPLAAFLALPLASFGERLSGGLVVGAGPPWAEV
jgi:hypothetical protein